MVEPKFQGEIFFISSHVCNLFILISMSSMESKNRYIINLYLCYFNAKFYEWLLDLYYIVSLTKTIQK